MHKNLLLLTLCSLSAIAAPLSAQPPRLQIASKSPVSCLTWSAKGELLGAGCADGTIQIIEMSTGKELRSFPTSTPLFGIGFSPESKTIAASHVGGAVSLWTTTGQLESKSKGVKIQSHYLVFTPDGQRVYGAGSNGLMVDWTV